MRLTKVERDGLLEALQRDTYGSRGGVVQDRVRKGIHKKLVADHLAYWTGRCPEKQALLEERLRWLTKGGCPAKGDPWLPWTDPVRAEPLRAKSRSRTPERALEGRSVSGSGSGLLPSGRPVPPSPPGPRPSQRPPIVSDPAATDSEALIVFRPKARPAEPAFPPSRERHTDTPGPIAVPADPRYVITLSLQHIWNLIRGISPGQPIRYIVSLDCHKVLDRNLAASADAVGRLLRKRADTAVVICSYAVKQGTKATAERHIGEFIARLSVPHREVTIPVLFTASKTDTETGKPDKLARLLAISGCTVDHIDDNWEICSALHSGVTGHFWGESDTRTLGDIFREQGWI